MSLEITLLCFGVLAIVVGYELNNYKGKRPAELGPPDDPSTKPHGA